MSVATPVVMTTEEMLALPDDGTERWLIRGRLRQKPHQFKDRYHASTMVQLGIALCEWNDRQAFPAATVLVGMVGCRLRRDPDTTVGIDVACVSDDVPSDSAGLVDGVPILAAEILSPDETLQEINDKIDEYLDAGVKIVWIIDPHDRTVTIYRKDHEPELVNRKQELSGEPELPGFRVAVSELFP